MESAPWMVPPGTTQSMEAIPPLPADGDTKTWVGPTGAPGSPKFWAQVELPDMFLSNLFHESDGPYKDDALTDFSGSASTGSEPAESPEAFPDFLLSHASDASSPSHESTASPSAAPMAFKPNAPTDDMLGVWAPPSAAPAPNVVPTMAMDPMFAPIFTMDRAAPAAPTAASAPAPASAPASTPESPPSEASPPPPPAGSAPELPGLPQMPTGSNANALTALARIREFAKHANAEAPHAAPAPAAPAASAAPREAADASPPPDGAAWSKKVAHNAIERRYRSNINDRIAGLRDVVPALREMRPRDGSRRRRRRKSEKEELVDGVAAATKMSKATVLSKATEYICYLKSRELQLDRQVTALQMLVRSLEGGEELLAAWNAEVARAERLAAPADAAACAPPTVAAEDESEHDEEDEEEDGDVPRKAPRYALGAFAGFAVLGGAGDWRGAPAPSLLKRSGLAAGDAHAYDAVPAHALVLVLLRAAAFVLGAAVLAYALTVRVVRWERHRRTKRAAALPRVYALPSLLQTPVEHAFAAEPERLSDARARYAALSDALPTFATRAPALRAAALALTTRVVARVPPLARAVALWRRHTVDATVQRLERHACLHRLLLELALGHAVQPSVAQRLLTLAAWEAHFLAAPPTPEERLVLALGCAVLAPHTVFGAWLAQEGALRWNGARAAHVDADGAQRLHAVVGDVLGLPLDVACTYAASASAETDASLVGVSPVRNVLDALRTEELLAFWSTLLASLMRGGGEPARAALRPHVLDVAADHASLLALRTQLTRVARERPVRNALAAEQLAVAGATLLLVAGHIARAQHAARALAARGVHSSAAHALCALVLRTPLRAAPPVGPVDALAAAVLHYMQLQRTAHAGAELRAQPVAELQALASQCVWEVVAPTRSEHAPAVVRSAARGARAPAGRAPRARAAQLAQRDWRRDASAAPRVPLATLTHALDTLMDRLSGLAEDVA
ncbi:hypothetical protein MOBT1_000300 [Malassezia obtusa]|uniref:BHLH domain-containing protein n=1 Tax=Malassezia obtusa TaxID=76774 RepID=A0AAF0IRZ3_9BASI|nr:hypothetical protein MOBT1_000300 [Malassezia obtusa]